MVEKILSSFHWFKWTFPCQQNRISTNAMATVIVSLISDGSK